LKKNCTYYSTPFPPTPTPTMFEPSPAPSLSSIIRPTSHEGSLIERSSTLSQPAAVSPTVIPAVSVAPTESIWTDVLSGEDFRTDVTLNIIPCWYGSGQGLRLEIIDAMDYPNHLYMTKSVEDWQASQALNLTLITNVPHEVLWKPQVSRIKVCNGDYGRHGLERNDVIEGEHIVVSSIHNSHELLGPHP
jgi:hypothetical protein